MSEKIRANTAATENSGQIDLGRLFGTFLDNRWMIVCAKSNKMLAIHY
jgi:uncharacterized protein involved in exopolysaccharide biosynthesis